MCSGVVMSPFIPRNSYVHPQLRTATSAPYRAPLISLNIVLCQTRTAVADYRIKFDKLCNYAFKFGIQKMGSHSIADHAEMLFGYSSKWFGVFKSILIHRCCSCRQLPHPLLLLPCHPWTTSRNGFYGNWATSRA